MIVIAATKIEIEPLLEYFRCTRNPDSSFPLYRCEKHHFIVSGIGKIRAAAALSHIVTKIHKPILNIGYAAGDNVGHLYNIHKVIDKESNKVFHLEKDKNLKNTALTTFSLPISHRYKTPVDMEASALVECAKIYKLPIKILKIISDPFDPLQCRQNQTLIEKHIDTILSLF